MDFKQRLPVFKDLGFPESALQKLGTYVDLLWTANTELNLISRQMSFAELIDNHVIDCMLPLKQFPGGTKIAADFGSGGGLPAVVYALAFPGIRYLAFEKSAKKREFLESCRTLAPNLEVHGEIPMDLSAIELVIARAFKPIDVILDMSRNYYVNGGKYFLLKGRREKIDDEIVLARKKFKNFSAQIEVLQSPVLQVERHLVLI